MQQEIIFHALSLSRLLSSVFLQSIGLMAGSFKLAYTTNTHTLMMLNAIDALPLVDIGNVYQDVDAASMTAINKVWACGQAGLQTCILQNERVFRSIMVSLNYARNLSSCAPHPHADQHRNPSR